jgi:2-polyprenyl-3-methyl-5-hydroxy-6-metoxy-1,4-benzoquinol methylase
MSIFTVGSDNPNLSYVIAKNPATIRESNTPFKRSLRKGVVHGWFTNQENTEFRLWFKDHDTESSFADGRGGEFEYLDATRYGNPYLPIAIITECLASAAKEPHDMDHPDMGYTAYVTTTILIASPSHMQRISDQYNNGMGGRCDVYSEFLPGQTWYAQVTIKAPTVYEALNILQVICIMQTLNDDKTYTPMNENVLVKFAKVFNRTNAPYYPRYLFKMKAIHNRDTFNKVKDDLAGPGVTLTFGDTRQQRFDAVREALSKDRAETLFDIGCGEMYLSLKLMQAYEQIFAIDADPEICTINSAKVRARQIENVHPIEALVDEDWIQGSLLFEGADILMSEVLEHIEKKEAMKTLRAALKAQPNRIVVTVPNKDFNVYYGFEGDEMRHDDHKWEPTFEEFSDDMVVVAAEAGYDVAVTPVGDIVNDSSVSSMAVFTKKKES